MEINIYINGKKESLPEKLTLLDLLKLKNIRPEVVTVELNETIINRKDYNSTIIKDKDKLEFVYYMGGGQMKTELMKVRQILWRTT